MIPNLRLIISIHLIFLLLSCSAFNKPTARKILPTYDWTIFVYGNGDNNLSDALASDIKNMEGATIDPERVAIIVVADYDGKNQNFSTGVSVLRINGSDQLSSLVADMPEMNLDDPEVLYGLARDTFQSYPAKRYGVVLWDHGGAWLHGYGGQDSNDETLKNEHSGMLSNTIRTTLERVALEAKMTPDKPYDFITLDTCVMGGSEVIHDFKDLTKIYIADAEISAGIVSFKEWFSYISSNVNKDIIEIGKAEIDLWENFHEHDAIDYKFKAISAYDMSKYENYLTATKNWIKQVNNLTDADLKKFLKISRDNLPSYEGIALPKEIINSKWDTLSYNLIDLGSLVRNSKNISPLQTSADQLLNNFDSLIFSKSLGVDRISFNQTGIHINFASPKVWDEISSSYSSLNWDKEVSWSGIENKLKSIYSPSSTPNITVSLDSNCSGTSPTTLPTLHFQSSDSNDEVSVKITTEAGISYGLYSQKDLSQNTSYQYCWDKKLLKLFNGTQTSMIELADNFLPNKKWIPVKLQAGTEQYTGWLTWDPNTIKIDDFSYIDEQIGELVYYSFDDFQSASITVTPILTKLSDSTTIDGTSLTLTSFSSLSLKLETAPSGNYKMILKTYDVWGNHTENTSNSFTI